MLLYLQKSWMITDGPSSWSHLFTALHLVIPASAVDEWLRVHDDRFCHDCVFQVLILFDLFRPGCRHQF